MAPLRTGGPIATVRARESVTGGMVAPSFVAARTRAVFEVGPTTYRWRDVEALARHTGEWGAFEQQVDAGLVALSWARLRGAEPSDDEVQAAGSAFRHRRRLMAADDMERWLADRRLTVGDWRGWLRRDLARRHADASGDRPPGTREPDLDEAVWVDGVCTGRLAAFADELAAGAALFDRAAETGTVSYGDGTPSPEMLGVVRERVRVAAHGGRALDDVVREHRLDWTLVRAHAVVVEHQDAAREVAAMLGDGRPAEEVALLAGVEARCIDDRVADIPDRLRPPLLSAAPGAVVGPVRTADGWAALRVVDRRPASLDEPEVLAAARRTVERRVVAREVAARVTWYERV